MVASNVIYSDRIQQNVLPNGTLQLIINPTMDGDEGSYSCVATTVGSTQVEHVRTAYLQFAFIVPQFARHPESKTAIFGSATQFFCIQDGSLPLAQIAWLKDGIPLPVATTDRFTMQTEELLHDRGSVSSSLLITAVRISDAGLYSCRATNPLLRSDSVYSNNATLTVEVPPSPPTFLETPTSILLPFAGVDTIFNCSVIGFPIPSVTWLHNDNDVGNSESVTITTQEQMVNSTLTIINAQQSNTGSYECRAENNGGTIMSDPAMLQIAGISQVFQVQPPANVLAVLNATTTIPCKPPQSIPPATVEWTKDFQRLSGDRFIVSGNNLSILNTRLSDSGIYYCTAFNQLTAQSVISQGANVSVRVSPLFTLEPVNRTVPVNGMANFSCQASGDPEPTIMWYQDETPITGPDSRLAVVEGNLIINPVMTTDDGGFICEASNIAGRVQATAYLNVQYPPKISSSFATALTAVAGQDALLHCTATGNPTPSITWLFGADDVSGVLANGSVLFSPVQTSNKGNYTCRATNLLGSSNATLALTIQVPATVVADQINVTVVGGQSINLTCRASGDPPPSVTWYDSNGDLIFTQDSRIRVGEGTLTFSPALKRDEGVITCVASNDVGNSSQLISLRVLITPQIIQPDNSSDVILVEGNTLSLHCAASGDPAPVITWAAPNGALSQGADRLLTYPNGSLFLYDVQKVDEGSYQCEAVNDAGRDSTNVSVTVWVSARVQTRSNHLATRGRNGLLNCQASGDPDPSINWFRNGTVLSNGTRYTTLENGSLWIRDVRDSDAGAYSCQAVNVAGSDTVTTNLVIYVIPAVVIPNPRVTAVQSQSLVLQCTATGFPNPAITWSFNQRQITVDDAPRLSVTPDGSLIINNVVVNDDGVYQCVATNAAGSDVGMVNLTVHVPPIVETTVNSLTAIQGDTVMLSCAATGIPTPTIVWRLDGTPVTTQGSRIVVRSGDLMLVPVANDDEGTYQCLAQNSAGIDDASIMLTVFVRPAITQAPINTTVSEGSSGSLICQADGDLQPVVSWMFNDSVVVVNSSVLTVSVATRADTGYYTCTATNNVGTASLSAYLDVFYAPIITQGPVSVTVPENASVSFTCEADANPRAEFSWLLDNQRITAAIAGVTVTGGRLMITMASVVHAGEVACVAMNVEGTISSIATLTVLFRPTAPLNVTATVLSATSVLLSWIQPFFDGGTPLTNYIITYRSSSVDHVTLDTNGLQLSRQLDGLAPFTAYQLQVSAENAVGIGPASIIIDVLTLVGAPSTPRSLSIVVSSETSVTLSWLPPDPTNGPLSVYEITYIEEGSSTVNFPRHTIATRIRITSLQTNVVYVVSVRGSTVREDDTLIFGSAAMLRIMNGIALPPIVPSSSITSSSLITSSSITSSLIASSITSSLITSSSITVSSSRAISTTPVTTIIGSTSTSSSSTMTTISSLNTLSTVVITTTDTTSTSSPQPTTSLTSSSTPLQSSTVTATSSSSALSSTALTSSSSLVLVTTTSTFSEFSSTITPSSRTVIETSSLSLTSTADSTSTSSVAATSPTPLASPSVVPQLTIAQPFERGTIILFWSFPGGTVDGYTVSIAPAPPSSPAQRNVTGATGLTVMGLADYTNYTFTVEAYNAAGLGPASAPRTVLTVEGVPSAPRNVTVERISASSITVSWEPPEFINGILQLYTIHVMRGSSNTVILSSTVNANESSTVIRGLEIGLYAVIVVAETGAGEGNASDSVPVTLTTVTATATTSTSLIQSLSTVDVSMTDSSAGQPLTTTVVSSISSAGVVTTSDVLTATVNATVSPTANVTTAGGEDSAVLEAIIPAIVAAIIIFLVPILIGWCWFRIKSNKKARQYRINQQSKKPLRDQRKGDDEADLIPFSGEDNDYFAGVQEALQTNFAFGSDGGDEMHSFGRRPSSDYTGPPLIPKDQLEDSSEDDSENDSEEFDGPYATADQVARNEKHLRQQHMQNGSKAPATDTGSNRSSVSGTYVSTDSILAKKKQDRAMSLTRKMAGYGDDDTGVSPPPGGTIKPNSYNGDSLINSDISSND